MDRLELFTHRTRIYTYLLLLVSNAVLIATWYFCSVIFDLPLNTCLFISIMVGIFTPVLLTGIIDWLFLTPLRYIWKAILYVSPGTKQTESPNTRKLHHGKEITEHIISYVYKLSQTAQSLENTTGTEDNNLNDNFVASSLPLPMLILDEDENVIYANKSMEDYIGKSATDLVNKSLYSSFDFSFLSDNTFDKWLAYSKQNTVTSKASWEHVKLTIHNDTPVNHLLDISAFYNKSNPNNYETILVFFDHDTSYGKDSQAVNFVALAVHELRTPLTMLRGYIEVFEEELSGKLTPDLESIMRKMKASGQQLTNFVNNILNVSKIEEDQITLNLHSDDWGKVLSHALQDLSLRASVRGIKISTNIQPGLPPVAVDNISIYEVISNLIDNAIKYSDTSKEIVVNTTTTKDGMIETTVQDFGVGVPESSLPHLFEKFYRDHHNKQQVGGTGIGLYLCKTFVDAHGGNLWVRSKEGEGTTFGFTLLPYDKLAEEQKNKDNNNITRSAHGWVKNHSLYRR